MIRNLPLLVLGAAALAACNPKPETIVANEEPDPMAQELANAAPVELPPAIIASKTYRCKDNSLVRIDWLQGGKGAHVTPDKATAPTSVEAAAQGGELAAADGTKVKGDAKAASVTVTLPGKGSQSCKA